MKKRNTALTTTNSKAGSGGILRKLFGKTEQGTDIKALLRKAGINTSSLQKTGGEKCAEAFNQALTTIPTAIITKGTVEKVVLLVDATNSMGPVWKAVLSGMRKIIERILRMNQNVRIMIIAYREYDGKVIEQSSYTSNSNDLEGFISRLGLIGNHTEDEAVECGLEYVLNAKPDIAILIGDSEPHGVGRCVPAAEYQRYFERSGTQKPKKPIRSYEHVCEDLKKARVTVHTIVTRDREEAVLSFREIADITGGYAFFLTDLDMLMDLICGLYAKSSGQLSDLRKIFETEATKRADRLLTASQTKVLGLLGTGASASPLQGKSPPKDCSDIKEADKAIELPKKLSDDPAAQARLQGLKAEATGTLVETSLSGAL